MVVLLWYMYLYTVRRNLEVIINLIISKINSYYSTRAAHDIEIYVRHLLSLVPGFFQILAARCSICSDVS